MRAVFDTNVLVSGIFFGGIPGRIVDAWLAGRIQACITFAILKEYLRVIDKISLRVDPIIERDWHTIFPEICHIIPDEKTHRKISRDPSDDKFIFCAINSNSDYLVSGDMDLKILPAEYSISIVSPAQFINILG